MESSSFLINTSITFLDENSTSKITNLKDLKIVDDISLYLNETQNEDSDFVDDFKDIFEDTRFRIVYILQALVYLSFTNALWILSILYEKVLEQFIYPNHISSHCVCLFNCPFISFQFSIMLAQNHKLFQVWGKLAIGKNSHFQKILMKLNIVTMNFAFIISMMTFFQKGLKLISQEPLYS